MELREVSLTDMLETRESRVRRQEELLAKYQKVLISFTMNIAGPIKNSDLILQGYLEGLNLLRMQLDYEGFSIQYEEEKRVFTGNEAFFVVNAPASAVKRLTCQIEEMGGLGRLFDMDVLGLDGRKLDRSEVGLPPRKCLICGGPAAVCASRRTHTVQELQIRTQEVLHEYFQRKFADAVAGLATQSLLYEVSATPKPGLVDRCNSGAHPDMDFYTFLRSTAALTPWLRDMALQGIRHANESLSVAFQALNYLGKQAEQAMIQATGGVNTHKGAIFSVGLMCGAAGRLYGRGMPLDIAQMLDECSALASNSQRGAAQKTAGDKFFQVHGIGGIRGEAAAGFPLVRKLGLPLLKSLLEEGYSPDDAGGIVLLHLMAQAEDTCLISRAGYEQWELIREQLKQVLSRESKPSIELRRALDEEFIRHNWSAGGCADLLAICWMALFMEVQDTAKIPKVATEILKRPFRDSTAE